MLILASAAALITGAAPAQETTPSNSLLTRPGWEVGGQISHYHYEEPASAGFGGMNLKGERAGIVGAYTFTRANRVYGRIDGRVSYGSLKYTSGSTGSMDDVPDWIAEVRAVVGRDYLAGEGVALSPFIGLGYRYLYDDLTGYSSTGAVGYRRYSQYLYIPVGLTARFRAGERWMLAPTIEYDVFLGGRQRSQLSDTGLGFNDVTNDQDHGYGYRASFMVENGRWAFGPWLQYWKIKDSDVVPIGGGFLGMEPENWTREYGGELRYRF
jgi:hypothetical protein